MTIVRIGPDGRVTPPAEALRAVGVEGETEVEIEADPGEGTVAMKVAHEDEWLYSDENIAGVRRAREQAEAGQLRTVSPDEFAALGETDR
jgi:hypothetical protein